MSGTDKQVARLIATKDLRKTVWEFVSLVSMFYFVIGFFSIVGVMMGQDVPYMPFWHAPWKWLFSLFL